MSTAVAEPQVEPMDETDGKYRGLPRNPKTAAEWKPWALRRAKIHQKNESGGRGRLTGATLIDVYGTTAIVRPANHGHTERADLDSIRLWWKGIAIADQHADSREGEAMHQKANPPAERPHQKGRPDTVKATDWVIYCPSTKCFLGGPYGKRSLYVPLAQAHTYKSSNSANVCYLCWVKHKSGAKFASYEVERMTYGDAARMIAARDAAAAKDTADVAQLASRIVDQATGRDKEPEEVKPDAALATQAERERAEAQRRVEQAMAKAGEERPQEAAKAPTPEAAQQRLELPAVRIPTPSAAVTREAFEQVRRARMEELAAEEMVLQARASRMRAETAMELERMERALGLVAV
jgi:hypothetical protein